MKNLIRLFEVKNVMETRKKNGVWRGRLELPLYEYPSSIEHIQCRCDVDIEKAFLNCMKVQI